MVVHVYATLEAGQFVDKVTGAAEFSAIFRLAGLVGKPAAVNRERLQIGTLCRQEPAGPARRAIEVVPDPQLDLVPAARCHNVVELLKKGRGKIRLRREQSVSPPLRIQDLRGDDDRQNTGVPLFFDSRNLRFDGLRLERCLHKPHGNWRADGFHLFP